MRYRIGQAGQRGGVTIVAVLSMFMLLTVAAVGLSRSSLREVFILATSRQSQDIRDIADAGLEWAVHWMNPKLWVDSTYKSAPLSKAAMYYIAAPEKAGQVTSVAVTADEAKNYKMLFDARPGEKVAATRNFDIQMTYMGQLPITDLSVQDKRLWPLLWMVRSKGTMVLGGMTFRHDREMWISTPLPELEK